MRRSTSGGPRRRATTTRSSTGSPRRASRIISRSLGSRYDGPGDGRGALDGVADHAVDLGIMWVNSGGNNAINRYYRAPVRLIGSSVAFGAAGSDTWLRFNNCIAPGGVRWANDWDAPTGQRTDYDVFLYHSPIGSPSTDDLLESALADQGGGAPPLEIIQGSACPAPGNGVLPADRAHLRRSDR